MFPCLVVNFNDVIKYLTNDSELCYLLPLSVWQIRHCTPQHLLDSHTRKIPSLCSSSLATLEAVGDGQDNHSTYQISPSRRSFGIPGSLFACFLRYREVDYSSLLSCADRWVPSCPCFSCSFSTPSIFFQAFDFLLSQFFLTFH